MKVEIRKDKALLESVVEKTGLTSEFILKIADEFDICNNAGKDAVQIILDAMQSERYLKYKNNSTRQSVVRSALCKTPSVDVEGDPFDEVVMVIGGCDRWGTNAKAPINYIAMKKNKQFVRIKSWDTALFSHMPCKARVVGTLTTDVKWGDSIVTEKDNISAEEPADMDTIQKALMRVAITPHTCGSEDLVLYNVPYAFMGKIQWVNPTNIWQNGENIGLNDVVCDDESTPKRKCVTCSISIDADNSGVGIAFNIDRARVKHPIVLIEDFESLAIDAFESSPGDRKRQASYLKDVLAGREIIAVGTVSGRKEKNNMLYVNVSTCFLMELNPDVKPVNEAPKLDEFKEPEPSSEPLSEEQRIVKDIIKTCEINGKRDASYIPVDKLRAIASIGEEYDDNMVREFAKAAEAQMKK